MTIKGVTMYSEMNELRALSKKDNLTLDEYNRAMIIKLHADGFAFQTSYMSEGSYIQDEAKELFSSMRDPRSAQKL